MAIGAIGVGSGLDLSSLVRNLVEAERLPTQQRLDRREARAQAQISAYGALRSDVSAVGSALSALASLTFRQTATSSDAASVRASVTGRPDNGSVQVQVQQLAQAQAVATTAFGSVDDPVGAGELTITVGAVSLTLDLSGGATLRDIRDQINARAGDAGLGVRASLVNDGTGSRLVLSLTQTGAANTIEVSVSDADGDDGDAVGLSRLASAHLVETREARDAIAVVDGLTVTSPSNTLAATIEGLSIELRAVTASPVTVTVVEDRGALRQRVDDVIKAFNAFNKQVRELSRFDADKREGALLTGDSTLRTLSSSIATALRAQGGDGLTLAALGVLPDREGNLQLDEARFNAVVAERGVEAVATALRELGQSAERQVSALTQTGGLLDTRTRGLQDAIRTIDQQRLQLDQRLSRLEDRLVRQFSALDSLVGNLQQTSNFLAAQLANLPGFTRPRR